MDIQLKKGLIEICVLKALTEADSYGYRLIKDLSEYIEISESTLYPILKRLENSNFLTVYSLENNGRLRKYYKITPYGHAHIESFINDWQYVMRAYNFILNGKGGEISDE